MLTRMTCLTCGGTKVVPVPRDDEERAHEVYGASPSDDPIHHVGRLVLPCTECAGVGYNEFDLSEEEVDERRQMARDFAEYGILAANERAVIQMADRGFLLFFTPRDATRACRAFRAASDRLGPGFDGPLFGEVRR